MLNMKSKSLVVLTATAIACTGLGIMPSRAASAASYPIAVAGNPAAVPITDFSSRRYYARRNNAAALGAFAAIAGTVAAVALARRHRHDYGYQYGAPAYGYAQPYGYGAPYGYYGPRYRGW